jgi:hypothetical protein
MSQLVNPKKVQTLKPQPETPALRLRIEQLESRIAPRCIVKMLDKMSPK